jgi:3-methyladenine DNA glycosylase/8-oxoguanine DNA glycosylase
MPRRRSVSADPPRDLTAAVAAATEELARRDPVLARLVAAVGPPELDGRRDLSHFGALCRSITFQQLAGRAAATIFGRFVKAATGGGEAVDLTPEGVLACPEEELRAAGLSAAKTRSIRALAERTARGELPLDDVEGIADEELIERLSAVPGIGRWTAEMFLIFQLGRLDVWPVGDLGVRKGYATAWGLPAVPTPKELVAYGETFRPYRSVAAWYCWRAVDTVVPDSSAATPPAAAKPAARKPAAAKAGAAKVAAAKTPVGKPPAATKAAVGKAAARKSPGKRS